MNDLLKQSHTATEVAREAFAAGDFVTGIAAIQLAAQLIQLARLFEPASRITPEEAQAAKDKA